MIMSKFNQYGISVCVGILSGEIYLDKLRDVILQAFEQRPKFNNLYFHQNGTSPHYVIVVWNLLDEIFSDKWISYTISKYNSNVLLCLGSH